AWLMLGLWLGLQLIGSLGSDPEAGGVAYGAHSGGFVVGILLPLRVFLKQGGTRYWARTEAHPPHPDAEYKFVRSNIPRVPRKPR
ncbi:MAG: rhomboid family intramembrane serine protease, partial [Arenibacterium sp.]